MNSTLILKSSVGAGNQPMFLCVTGSDPLLVGLLDFVDITSGTLLYGAIYTFSFFCQICVWMKRQNSVNFNNFFAVILIQHAISQILGPLSVI